MYVYFSFIRCIILKFIFYLFAIFFKEPGLNKTKIKTSIYSLLNEPGTSEEINDLLT